MKRRERGTGSLLKLPGCAYWYAQVFRNGKHVRISTRQTSKEAAKLELRKLIDDADHGIGIVPGAELKRIRYGDLRELLLKKYREKNHKSLQVLSDGTETIWGLPQLDNFAGFGESNKGPSMLKLDAGFRDRFVEKRQAEGVGPSVINSSLRHLRHMLNLGYRKLNLATRPYIELLSEPAAREGFLELDDFQKLMAALPERFRPLIHFLYFTGVRISEARQVDWSQVDLDAPIIELRSSQTKNKTARLIPLTDELVKMLRQIEPKKGPVFDADGLRREWEKACTAVGLGVREKREGRSDYLYHGLMVHDLRRSAVRNLRHAGIPEDVAMKISGHKTRSVFSRYNIVDREDVLQAMKRVEKSAVRRLDANSMQIENKRGSAKLVSY